MHTTVKPVELISWQLVRERLRALSAKQANLTGIEIGWYYLHLTHSVGMFWTLQPASVTHQDPNSSPSSCLSAGSFGAFSFATPSWMSARWRTGNTRCGQWFCRSWPIPSLNLSRQSSCLRPTFDICPVWLPIPNIFLSPIWTYCYSR